MSIKKYSSGSWVDIPYRKYGTETDTITNLPKEIIGDGQSASANIIGNMNQQGTPSPSNIIMPDECGNKTANLLDTTGSVNGYINASGEFTTPHANLYTTDYLPIPTGASSITQSYNLGDQMLTPAMCFYDSSKTFISGESFQYSASKTFQVPANAVYFRTCYRTTFSWCMVNTGSTALPYQPYGYKIPILSGGVTTNKYLGEVQSERQIYKLVLTGQETGWNFNEPNNVFYLLAPNAMLIADSITSICTHYKAVGNKSLYINMSNNEVCIRANDTYLWIKDTTYSTIADFKTYLQQQYANGTPVTVWYVLATPTTGVVNEPIRKIGDYADSVSVTGIPTTGTAESFDIDTTLKPSEVELTYHGWHSQEPNKYEETGQLYDKTTDVNGYRLNPSGNLIAENGYSTSLAIPVNTKFLTRNHEFSTMEPICEYKANNTFIARTVSGSTIELNDETSYVRMTVNNTWDDVTLKGSQWT